TERLIGGPARPDHPRLDWPPLHPGSCARWSEFVERNYGVDPITDMGLTSLHGQLTVAVLRESGFSDAAANLAAEGNEAVDAMENQGNAANLANMHAMRGFLGPSGGALSMRGRRMQTEDEARAAVAALLQALQDECLEALRGGRDATALTKMGAALHTVQDREYHRFEPWPYKGIDDALLNGASGAPYGLAPDYMFCHVQRDVGYVNGLLSLSLTAFDYSAGYQSGHGWSLGGRVEVTQVSSNPAFPHLSVGVAGRTGGPFGDEGVVYGLLTWGRIPSRPEAGSVPPNRQSAPLSMQRGPALCSIASEGANSLASARRATTEFVDELSRQARPEAWRRLQAFRG
ncbi:MAG TPA: hypothetical protein VKE96_19560, partial [Vicinamibacterales bacterium]|nr:hypothetical protein [Vicinamibacterales bacterium]